MQIHFAAVVLLSLHSVSALPFSGPKDIIFDTDFLSFPDDVGALALGNAFQQLGKAKILGVASDIKIRYSIPAIDAINTYYKHPHVPFAQDRSITDDTVAPGANGSPVFVTKLADVSRFPQDVRDGSNKTISTPLDFYQSTLSKAKDKSVTILAIGFLNNLDELYHSEGGKELIERKVAELVVQGGDFGPNRHGTGPNRAGYNLVHNINAAKVLEDWPSPVTYLGSNIGRAVLTGAVLEKTPKSNPVREAYEIYLKGKGIKNGSWDLLATYYGVLGIDEGSFKYGNGNRGGKIEIRANEDKPNESTAGWNYDATVPPQRRQHYLDFKETADTIARKVDDLLSLTVAPEAALRIQGDGRYSLL